MSLKYYCCLRRKIISYKINRLDYWLLKLFSKTVSRLDKILSLADDEHWLKACSRSATRSSASSKPMDKRTRLSCTPAALLFSAGMDLCVMLAGCDTRLLMPPKLSA